VHGFQWRGHGKKLSINLSELLKDFRVFPWQAVRRAATHGIADARNSSALARGKNRCVTLIRLERNKLMSGKIIKSGKKPVARKSGLSVTAQKVSVAATKMLASNHNENLALKSPARKKAEVKAPVRGTRIASTKRIAANHNEMLVIR
jgi:hypothetical protein